MSRKLFRGKGRFSKLNDFIEHSDYEVITKRTVDRQGRKRGKSLLFKDTVDEFVENLEFDCQGENQFQGEKEAAPGECEKRTMREDTADFCLFGKRCISDAVYQKINEKYDETENSSRAEKENESLENERFSKLTDEEIQMIADDDIF